MNLVKEVEILGIFNTIKKLLKGDTHKEDNRSLVTATKDRVTSSFNTAQYIKELRKKRYEKTHMFVLENEVEDGWGGFFSMKKENPKFIGFDRRSRRKFRRLYHNDKVLVAEAGKTIEVVQKGETKKFSIKETTIEKFRSEKANQHGVILRQKNSVAMVNLSNGMTYAYEFEWQPLTIAMGETFWLVGTRETFEGPGELYCFDYEGEQKWGISFTESFDSVYGKLTFMPYKLEVSSDSTDIFVTSMDRLYRLNANGGLQARIAVSDLKQKDFDEKVRNLNEELSREPKNQEEAISMLAKKMAAQFTLGFEARGITSPYSDFAHDPKTDMLYLMEKQGRISAWDQAGQLIWVNTFKQDGTYLNWLDEKIVASFETGESFWMKPDGSFLYGAKLPKQAVDISLIPNKETYLVVCEDHRLYELHKETGELIRGAEGHPGMELFRIAGQNIFFDGEYSTQGYFWLAPEGKEWEHFQAKDFTEMKPTDVGAGVAPEITSTSSFNSIYTFTNEEDWFGGRIIDMSRKRIYVVERGSRADIRDYTNMTEAKRRKDQLNHNIVCYQLDGTKLWEMQMYSGMWSFYASPDKNVIFTSAPSKEEITYKPGTFYIISSEGEVLKKQKVKAHGFHLNFLSSAKGIVRFASEEGKGQLGIVKQDVNGNWDLDFFDDLSSDEKFPFGAGMYHFQSTHFQLDRLDKKKYTLRCGNKTSDLNLKAAVYEAMETPNFKLVFRTGKRLVTFYDQELSKILEIKESEDIQGVSVGKVSIAIMTKSEIKGYTLDGQIQWRYSVIPKTQKYQVAWIPEKEVYLWVVENPNEKMIALLTENGEVVKSQSFNARDYHRDVQIFSDEGMFAVQTNGTIRIMEVR
jgi:hypothetical protein